MIIHVVKFFFNFFSQLKIWDTLTGFSFVTFDQHTGGVTDVKFIESGKAVISSSQDGTVRAFDLNRYAVFYLFFFPNVLGALTHTDKKMILLAICLLSKSNI